MPSSPSDVTLQSLFQRLAGPQALPQWDVFAQGVVVQRVAAGQTIFLQGATDAHGYAVLSGLVQLCYWREDGEEWVKSLLSEGQWFASASAQAPGGRTSFAAVALEPCVLERFALSDVQALAARHLPWVLLLGMALLHFAQHKEQRERELLVQGAAERYRALAAAEPARVQRVPQKVLADYLGLTLVGLNRIIQRKRLAAMA